MYDPFTRGPHRVKQTDFIAEDEQRARRFPCTSWSPLEYDSNALVLFSHFSGGSRMSSTFLCEHLASHGYAVAALDHPDTTLPRPSDAADPQERQARRDAWIAARVPDVRFLLRVAGGGAKRVGIVGHSFGGWTALATPSEEGRIEAVVALAPAGASRPRPGSFPRSSTLRGDATCRRWSLRAAATYRFHPTARATSSIVSLRRSVWWCCVPSITCISSTTPRSSTSESEP